jgi:Predicted membrane protein
MMSITGFLIYRTNPMLKDRDLLREVVQSKRKLHEEKDSKKVMENDKEFINELNSYAKSAMSSLGITFAYLIVLLLVYPHVIGFINSDPVLMENKFLFFLSFLALYETFFAISFVMSRIQTRRLNKLGGMPVAGFTYIIKDKGLEVIAANRITLHALHLATSEIKLNEEKKYVEIIARLGNNNATSYRIRLYSENAPKVYELVSRFKKFTKSN